MNRQVLPQTGREIEIRTTDEWELPIPREKTRVVHQIGIDIAAETHRLFEVLCEQQKSPSAYGAENSGFVSTC